MGKGNVCVFGKYEGLYYVDYDFINMYTCIDKKENLQEIRECEMKLEDFGSYTYDEILSDINYQDFKENFVADFTEKYKSFTPCNEWISRDRRAILENNLFYIALADNEWSVAVMLLQKEQCSLEGLQARHFQNYLEGIKECLFNQFESLGIYGGAWTSGILHKTNSAKEKDLKIS